MKKKILIITTVLTLAIFFNAFLNVENADNKTFNISLDSKPITLENPIITQNGTIMLPLKDTLNYFGAHLDYYEDQKKINYYYNNSFACLYIDKNNAFINGNKIELKEPVSLINSTSYVPLKFFCDFLNLEYSQNNDNLALKTRYNKTCVLLNSKLYTEHKFNDYNLSLAIPESWKLLKSGYYGVENPYEKYGFKIKITDTNQKIQPEYYLDNIIRNAKPKSNFDMVDIKKSEIKTANHTFYTLYYTIEKNEAQARVDKNSKEDKFSSKTKNDKDNTDVQNDKDNKNEKTDQVKKEVLIAKHHSYYVCQVANKVYEFHFNHSKKNLNCSITGEFETLLQSLKVKPYDMSPVYEHYIEYPRFSELGINLISKIHSSMEIYNKFNFAGSITYQSENEIYCRVSRDKEAKTTLVPIKEDGSFDAIIYVPFGIGKHNIELYEKDINNNETILLRFNIVNLSPKKIYYLIPGDFIKPYAENIKSDLETILISKLARDKFVNEYQYASAIFKYIAEKIVYDQNQFYMQDNILSADQIDLSQKISSTNTNIYLASLMRSAGIQCRIIEGINQKGKHIFLECKINGAWKVFDISSEIEYKNTDNSNRKYNELIQINKNIMPIDVFKKFYYVDSSIYKQFFTEINYLDY